MTANQIPEAAVDALYDELFRVGRYLHAPVPIDPKEIIRRHLAAAQQQSAMEFDGTDREVLREFIRICREHKPVGQWPGERVCRAIERAMANEKPFRFIAEADMAPERAPSMKDADRILSGPRRASPPPAAAEAKTLPVPTHVYLTDKAAVIVGDPQRGWDEEGPEAHNCDAMGCATIGPHVLARVPFTDERAMSQPAEAQPAEQQDESEDKR